MIHALIRPGLLLFLLLSFSREMRGQENLFHENIEHYGQLYKRPWLTPFTIEYQAGGAYYSGDLIGGLAVRAENYLLNPALCLALDYRLTDYIHARIQGSYFRLRVTANQPEWGEASFRSNNLVGTVMVLHDIFSKRATEAFEARFNPYFGFGLGLLRYEPRDVKTGDRYRVLLDSMGVATFTNTTLAIPITFGVTYTLFENIWIGFEANYHFTRTDLLDAATPPQSSKKDGFYLFGFRAGIQLYNTFNYRNYLHSK